MSNNSVVAAIPTLSESATVPTLPVPDTSGKTAYDTVIPAEIKEYLNCKGDDRYINSMVLLVWTFDAAHGGMIQAVARGLVYFWDEIFPDAWKAHCKRDYLYHDVVTTVLLGDKAYRDAKAQMIRDKVPAWNAFPQTGAIGALEVAELMYWRVRSMWESVVASLRLPLDQLPYVDALAATPLRLSFDQLWHNTLKKNHFFGYFPQDEKVDGHLRGFTIDGRDESFKVLWSGYSDDPDQDEIAAFATLFTQLVNGQMMRHLKEAVGEMIRLVASIKKADDDFFAHLLPYTTFDDRYWQEQWRACRHCRGLFFGRDHKGVCPESSDGHDRKKSYNYILHHNDPHSSGQHDWRWCKKCQGLFFGGRKNNACSAGGHHDASGSGDYIMHTKHIGGPERYNEEGWRWCKKCQGLYQVTHEAPGKCPANGAHDFSGSGHYMLRAGRSDEELNSVR